MSEETERSKVGRPSEYDEAVAEAVCTRLIEGESLRAICREDGMPSAPTIFRWMRANEEFRLRYAHAREMQADLQFDELLEIADDGKNDWMEKRSADGETLGWRENGEAVRRSVLRVDTRKWRMSKLLPKKYGEKLDVNHGGKVEVASGPDLSGLSADERAVMKELILKAEAAKKVEGGE